MRIGVLNIHYVSKDSGTVTVPRYRLHCLGRGDTGAPSLLERDRAEVMFMQSGGGGVVRPEVGEWDLELRVREWTEPNDGEKEVFFRNLAGVVSEPRPGCWNGLLCMLFAGVRC